MGENPAHSTNLPPGDEYFQLPPDEVPSDGQKKMATAAGSTTGGSLKNQNKIRPRKKEEKKKRKRAQVKREKLRDGELIKSEVYVWKVNRLLGSGGFGDVYKVAKVENLDKKEYALKTEMVEGDRRLLRLKIEVSVLKECQDQSDPDRKRHFIEYVDREKFKFLVMGLVGPSLEDIRRQYLLRNFSRATAMNTSIQTLKSVSDLHFIGFLHRDIKPANFAVGLADKEDVVYMLDFGIARKIFKPDSREIKTPRSRVKFLGTLRFAARACHFEKEQGRKDDVETWLYMAFDLLDADHGLPWKRAGDKKNVIHMKEKFFLHSFPKAYKIVPKEFRKIVDYVNNLSYADEPDYKFIEQALLAVCSDYDINLQKKLDWIGKLKKKPMDDLSSSDTSSDNRQSGSESDSTKDGKQSDRKKSDRNKRRSKPKATNTKKASVVSGRASAVSGKASSASRVRSRR